MVLNLVRSNPRGSLSQSQGFGRGQEFQDYFQQYHFMKFMFCWVFSLNTVILCASDTWFILCTNKIYLCFKEIIFYLSNYEGFGECTDEACRVQYLQ